MAEAASWLAIGAATGFFAGLLGIGGGTILVSSLALMFTAQAIPSAYVMHMAIGTSLAAIVAGSWASFRTHHRHGAVDWRVVRTMVPGVLLGALGACTVITLRMYADRKEWPLESARVRLRTARSHEQDCEVCETDDVGPHELEREIELTGPLTDEQRQRLLMVADRCPVKQTLERGIQVVGAGAGATG